MKYLIAPWKHQLEAIERASRTRDFAFFMEMGTGKTCAAINSLRHKYYEASGVKRTLILCPPIVIENWKKEFELHSKVGPKVILLYGTGKKRLKLLEEQVLKDDGIPFGPIKVREPVIVVTNFETLLMKEVYAALTDWKPEILVVDEVHKCKDMKSTRTKQTIKLADLADHRYILTGTPILNSPLDIFAQFRILDGGETFGRNYFAFRAQYFFDGNAAMPRDRYFPNWKIRPGALEEITEKISKKSMHVKKADCLDLPPLVKKEVNVELSPEQSKIYEDLKKDYVAYVGSEACVATLAITKALRLMQVVSGYVVLERGDGTPKRNKKLDNPRAEALRELLELISPTAKVIVWAVFKENYETIRNCCDDLKISYTEVHGDVPSKTKFENVERFNTDESCRVLIGPPGSGGIGINLVSASYSIFYSRNFSLEQDLQAEARNYRGGSEIHEKVTRIDLIAAGTIDEIIAKRLAGKQEISDKVLRDLAKEI